MDRLEAKDLGVGPETLAVPGLKVGYIDVAQTPEYTLCMFALRKGAHIPLHDHPGMYVFGRHLFGLMRVVSFDLGAVDVSTSPRRHRAQVRSAEVYGPAARTYWLGPEAGNVHYLEALEDCCFFDVVSPPYSPQEGRDCTYFQADIDVSLAEVGQQCIVQDYWPINFYTEPLLYKGFKG